MLNTDTSPTFDRIAAGWYSFRHHSIFKNELTELARRWQRGRLLNLGCGHGADFLPFKGGFELYGIDESLEMLKFAAKYAREYGLIAELKHADMRDLPYPDAYFDQAIAVASLHHLKGEEESFKAFSELRRVLKPGGEAFLTVWNACQPKFWFRRRDLFVPWRTGDDVVQRFYHLFTFFEIERLCKKAGFSVLNSRAESKYRFPLKYFSRNICLLVKRKD